MYQALYRKWRPKTFDDVIGQEQVTKTLKNEVTNQKISHAYLFTGSRGTGKTSCAKILAKAINCLNPENGNPCGKCKICQSIDSENMLDISEIDAASNNGVENIRAMREEVVFSPTKCKYRVYIVDEVHMLSTGAFNAFLKVLEEPPPHVVFILATTEVHKLPATIISRCQRFDFYRISSEDIFKRIKYICEKESIKIEEQAARDISFAADGAMRDALSILDQCANSCQNQITEKSVKNILGVSGTEYIEKIAKNIFEHNAKECLKITEKAHQESKNMLRLCEELIEYFRNLMIFKISEKNEENKFENAKNISVNDVLFYLDTLQNSYKNITAGTNKKIEMEICIVKMCQKSETAKNTTSKPLHTDKKIDLKENTVLDSPPPIAHNTIFKEEEKPSESQKNGSFEKWNEILKTLKENKSLKSLYISLKNSNAYEKGNYILIESENELSFELLRKLETRNELKKIIKNITGKSYNLGPYTPEICQTSSSLPSDKKEQPDNCLNELINNAKSAGIKTIIN